MANINETEENVDNKELSKKELKALKKKEKADKTENNKKSRKEKKLEKKLEKEKEKNKNAEENEETEGGNKAVLVLVTLLIIVIWLGIIALLIKADVGGFGSSVLQPILKDVPVINKILPASDEIVSTESESGQYSNVGDAVEQIKELEKHFFNDCHQVHHLLCLCYRTRRFFPQRHIVPRFHYRIQEEWSTER